MTLALLLLLAAVPQADERSSPFSGVKWTGEKPVVRVDGDWYELVSLNGIAAAKIVAFCQKEFEERWKKRFSEDLVEEGIKIPESLFKVPEGYKPQ